MGLVQQLISPSKLNAAQASIQAGGDGVREGVAMILTAMAEYLQNEDIGGTNGSQVLAAAMRRLTEDPYLTLGVEPESDEGVIKKAYRKLALKYHPDKNKATPTLFQTVQGAHDVLIEPAKRAEYDIKRKKQQEALNRLRKQPKATGAAADNRAAAAASKPAGSAAAVSKPSGSASAGASAAAAGGATPRASPHAGAGGGRGGTSATGAAGGSSKKPNAASAKGDAGGAKAKGQSTAASENEKLREFNKRFYEECRREAQLKNQAKAGKGAAGVPAGASTHQPPLRPKMRSTNRTENTVTLEWRCGDLPVTTAYELQWRQRGRAASDWVTSPTLVVGNSCRKKNLDPCTCYEFRVRAASAWGWSAHCDPVMVVTLPSAAGGAARGDDASASPRQKVSGFQSDGIGGSAAAAEKARAQVEEARRRRSQAHGGSSPQTRASSQFRSSSIAGNDGAGSVDEKIRKPSQADRSAGHRASDPQAGRGGPASAASPAESPGMDKTNSWYWRRMSRAAAQDEPAGARNEKAQRRQTMQEQGSPSKGAWACVVCKRQNEPASKACWVCYTARSYQAVNLDRIRTDNEGPGSRGGSPLNSARRSSIGSRPGSANAPAEDSKATKQGQAASTTTARDREGGTGAGKSAGGLDGPGAGVSEKVPSIRVYSVPSETAPKSSRGNDTDGIRVSASAASGSSSAGTSTTSGVSGTATPGVNAGSGNPADVWEFTEGDLDNVGSGPKVCGSDDEWSNASGAGGLDTRSDPGDPSTYRRRSSTNAARSTQGAEKRRGSTQAAAAAAAGVGGGHGSKDGDDAATRKRRYLNGRITKLHNVRAEPIRKAKVVGYLTATKEVEVLAEVGDWFKVRWHKRAKDKAQKDPFSSSGGDAATPSVNPTAGTITAASADSGRPASAAGGGVGGEETSEAGEADDAEDAADDEAGCGWCLTRDSKHAFIVTIGAEEAEANRRPVSATSHRRKSASGRRRSSVTANRAPGLDAVGVGVGAGLDDIFGEEDDGECWHELHDEDGLVYYFNAASGVSQWEPPLWLDEIDPATGAVYYVNSESGEPQWEKPAEFIPIVRENPYATTPEEEFLKSVLSPKRSKGAKSFHEAMQQAASKAARAPSAIHLNAVSEGGGGATPSPRESGVKETGDTCQGSAVKVEGGKPKKDVAAT